MKNIRSSFVDAALLGTSLLVGNLILHNPLWHDTNTAKDFLNNQGYSDALIGKGTFNPSVCFMQGRHKTYFEANNPEGISVKGYVCSGKPHKPSFDF